MSIFGSVVGGLVSGLVGGGRSAPAPAPVVINQPAPRETADTSFGQFLEYLPPILASIPRYEPPTQQEIILKLPEETKESGQMENGPQVYQGFTGALGPLATQAGKAIGRTIFGGGAGGVAGGGAHGAAHGAEHGLLARAVSERSACGWEEPSAARV